MSRRWFALGASFVLLTGCGSIPEDPEGTTERVQTEGAFRVGIVAPRGTISPMKEADFLKRVALTNHAKPVLQSGAAETLLTQLEEGKLDLVIGEFSPGSPWSKSVHFLPPLAEKVTEKGHSLLAVAVRNGENQWVSILQREAAAVSGSRT